MDIADRLRTALAGRYRIEGEIGRGGMAIVYLARDLKHGRRVAIKALRPELSASVGGERFLREIEIAAGLQHPHIVPLYDSGDAEGVLYYVMPFVEGETLRDRLQRDQQLPIEEAVQVAQEVAAALSVAHGLGVVHRDVKPANIFLSGGHTLLADFGVARALAQAGGEPLTDVGVAVGTPHYMSPEQGTGEREVDARSDIYALACVLFEMLAGEPPFTGRTPQAVIARHVSEPPPSLRVVRPSVPAALERVIERALAKVPADRYPTALAFGDALAAAQAEEQHPAPRGRRVRRGLLLGGFGLVAAAAIVLALVDLRPPSPAGTAAPPSRIAVLYFEDRSADGSLRPVADGLTQDLIDELTRIEQLQVASASQVRPYRDAGIPADSLARLLGVGALVEGIVAGSWGRPRITVRLVGASTGAVLETGTFEADHSELLRLREELVGEMLRMLRRGLGKEVERYQSRAEARSVEAWELVQRAQELREYARSLSLAGDLRAERRALDEADSLLARAEAVDSTWVIPVIRRGWLASAYALLLRQEPDRTHSAADTRAAADRLLVGLERAERALALRPGDPRALELRGALRLLLWQMGESRMHDTLVAAAERDLRAALRGDPALAAAWYSLSELLLARGEVTEAEHAARKALEKDAYLASAEPVITRLYWATLNRGDFDGAGRWCEEGRQLFPENANFVECRLTILGWSAAQRLQLDSAWAELARIDRDERLYVGRPYRRMLVAAILARLGLRDSAEAVIRAARREFPEEELYTDEAYVRLLLGQRRAALDLLRRFVERHPEWRAWLRAHLWFRDLHADTAFQRLTGEAETPRAPR